MNSKDCFLPELVSTDEFPLLKSLSKLQSGIYKLVIPEGVNGSLMTLSSGDLSGLNTTSIVADGKIVGTAGMEEVELSKEATRLLLKLTNYSVLAERINSLSQNFRALINLNQTQYKAVIDNMILMFRDISRKMPAILEDENYNQLVMNTLPILKRDAGQFFELQKGLFIDQYRNDQRQSNNLNSHIGILDEYKKHPVFYAYNILLTIEIYEVMITGKNNQHYMSAVRESLNERIQPVVYIIDSKYHDIIRQFNNFVANRENDAMSLFQHNESSKKEKELYDLIQKTYTSVIDIKNKSNEYLDDKLSIEGLKEIYFQIENKNNILNHSS
ncbi:hypothetical protein [Pectobacterium versatile]|uniref:hypothetical protein n=1 Tax=Pectobacterium versatile TaxID=2488639 RepID=UPI003815CE98